MTELELLIQDIVRISTLMYAPAAIKMQMVMLSVSISDARIACDWQRAIPLRDELNALRREYLSLPAQNIPNEESSLYAAALQNAAEE